MTMASLVHLCKALLAALALTLVALVPARAAEEDRGVLANLISQALSSPSTTVSVGAVEGALSSNATIRGIVLSDRDGPWLKVATVRLVWSRLALLQRRLQVDQLTIDNLEVLRRPLGAAAAPAAAGQAVQGPILPELPVKVVIEQFAIDTLTLGAPLVGVVARLKVDGAATLGAPSEGLDAHLHAQRLDAAGDILAKLQFVPATNLLAVNLDADEPAGGLIAHLANLPGAPPIKLAFDGSGPLDAFHAKLDFSAGPDIGATGQVDLTREGAGRHLALAMTSRLEGLAPTPLKSAFAGTTALKGEASIGDDGGLKIPGLHLTSENARLDIEGSAASDHSLDLKLHVGVIPGATAMRALDFNAAITGPLSGPNLEAKFDAAGVKTAQGALDAMSATFSARSNGPISNAATRIAVLAQAEVQGLALADPALAQAVGSEVSLTLRGSASPAGEFQCDALGLVGPALRAKYAGILSADTVRGHLDVAAPDLARFAALAGLTLRGQINVAADLDGAPRAGALAMALNAHATGFETGLGVLDSLLGGRLDVMGTARSLAGGGFGFTDLLATGANGSVGINGEVGAEIAALTAKVDVPQASALDPRVVGQAQAALTLSGTLARLDANVQASLGPGRLLDRPTAGLTLAVAATDVTDHVAAHAKFGGDVDGHSLEATANLAKLADGGWSLDKLALDLASVHVSGAVAMSGEGLAKGAVTFAAGDLDDLSALALTKLSGALKANVAATVVDGRQDLAVDVASDAVGVGANRLGGLKANLTLADAFGAKILSGALELGSANVAGQALAAVKLSAKPQGDASVLDLSLRARGLAIKGQGRLTGGTPMRLELASLSAVGGVKAFALTRPATLTFQGVEGVDIKGFSLAVNAGRLTLDGLVGATLQVKAGGTAVPLSALDVAVPGLGLGGVADFEASIAGTPSSPRGDWRLSLKGLTAPQTRSLSAPGLDAAATGALNAGRTSLDATVRAGPSSALRITGSAPIAAAGLLDVKIAGTLDAALANGLLGAGGQRVGGALTIDASIQGTIAAPQAHGAISLSQGAFSDDQSGFRLAGVDGRITLAGDALRIERLLGTTPNGGAISASGDVRLEPAAGFPGTLRLIGKRAQIASNDTVAATADFTLDASSALGRTPRIAGRIDLLSMDVTVPERFAGASAPIPGTRHLNPSATARARLALAAKDKAARGGGVQAALALVVSAPSRVFVRGRGINAEFGGSLSLDGPASGPRVTGGFDLRRGALSLLGKRLNFTRGRVLFHGGTMPELDLLADVSAADVVAHIGVTGAASGPSFAFTSTPSLPQDEILARVLFQKPSGGLSAFQAIQLANAVASLTGGGDAFERLRKSLGVDSLDIGTGASSGPSVGISKALNERLSIGVKTGARPEDNGVSMDFDVTNHVRLQAGVDANGGSSVGVGMQWEYK